MLKFLIQIEQMSKLSFQGLSDSAVNRQKSLHVAGMAARVSKDGVTISGSDMVYNYQQVLRQIVYTNRKPAYYLNRVFKLTCSELNGRFTSNEYVQTVSANKHTISTIIYYYNILQLTVNGYSSTTERTDNRPCNHQQTHSGNTSGLDHIT